MSLASSQVSAPVIRFSHRGATRLGKQRRFNYALQARTGELERDKLLVVHCKGGYRSSIATSLQRRYGFRDIANLTGGFDAWKSAGLPCALPASQA